MRRIVAAILVVVVAVAGTVWIFFERDMRRHQARLEGHSRIIETSFGAMEYADEGSGTPVLSIHGAGGGFDQGMALAGPLVAAGHRVIAPSRFGYLRSPAVAAMTAARQADAFAELLDQLGIGKAAIFGASAGTLSALEFAARHPDRCTVLVLMVPAVYAPDRKADERLTETPAEDSFMRRALGSDFMLWAGIRLFPGQMTRYILATDPELVKLADQETQDRIGRVLDEILPISARIDGLMFDGAAASDPAPVALDLVECPVLAISAEDDLYATAAAARYVAQHVKQGKALIYEKGGHMLVGHPEVLPTITAFIEQAPGVQD